MKGGATMAKKLILLVKDCKNQQVVLIRSSEEEKLEKISKWFKEAK